MVNSSQAQILSRMSKRIRPDQTSPAATAGSRPPKNGPIISRSRAARGNLPRPRPTAPSRNPRAKPGGDKSAADAQRMNPQSEKPKGEQQSPDSKPRQSGETALAAIPGRRQGPGPADRRAPAAGRQQDCRQEARQRGQRSRAVRRSPKSPDTGRNQSNQGRDLRRSSRRRRGRRRHEDERKRASAPRAPTRRRTKAAPKPRKRAKATPAPTRAIR